MSQEEIIVRAKSIIVCDIDNDYMENLRNCIEDTLYNLEIDRFTDRDSFNKDLNKLTKLVRVFYSNSNIINERVQVM